MRKLFLASVAFLSFNGVFSQTEPRQVLTPESPHFISGENLPYTGDARRIFSGFLPLGETDELRFVSRETDALSFVHEKYRQYHKNIPGQIMNIPDQTRPVIPG
jgi:hypothetical protein